MTKRGSPSSDTRCTSRLLSTSDGDAVEDVDAQVLAGVADGFRALERAAAGEDREAAKERLLGRRQQVVAPLDRPAQRLLAFRQVARAAGQQLERPLDAGQELARAAGS